MGAVPALPEQIVERILEHLYADLARPTLRPGDSYRPTFAYSNFARFARVSKAWNRRAVPMLVRYFSASVAMHALEMIERDPALERAVDWVDLASGGDDRKAQQVNWRRLLEVTLRHARRLDLDTGGGLFHPVTQLASCRDLVAALPALGTLPSLAHLSLAVSAYWPLPTIGAVGRKAPNLVHLEVRGPTKRPQTPPPPLTFALSAIQGLRTLRIASITYTRFEIVTGLFPSLVYPSSSSLVSLHLEFPSALASEPVLATGIFPFFPSLRTLTLLTGFIDCAHPAFFSLFPSVIEASICAPKPLTTATFPVPRSKLRFLTFNILRQASAPALISILTDPTLAPYLQNLLALDLDFTGLAQFLSPSPLETQQLIDACAALHIRLSGAFLLMHKDGPYRYRVREGERTFWTLGEHELRPGEASEDEEMGEDEVDDEDEEMDSVGSSDGDESDDSLDYDAGDCKLFRPWWSEEKKRGVKK